MSEVKLTEAEARGAWQATYSTHAKSFDAYCADLRERGLMEPEPVDPLLVEAREIVRRTNGAHEAYRHWSQKVAEGEHDDHVEVRSALAALRRGMELGKEPARPLTVEEVKAATVRAGVYHYLPALREDAKVAALHAALTSLDGGRDG